MRLAVLLCGAAITATGCNGARFCGYTVVRTPAGGCPASGPTGYAAAVPGKMMPPPPAAPRPLPLAAPAAGNQDMMLVPQVIFVPMAPQAATGPMNLSALGGQVLPTHGQETGAGPQLAEVLEQMRMLNARLADLEARTAARSEPVLIPPVQDPVPPPTPTPAAAAPPTATVLPPMPPASPTWAAAPMSPPHILPPIPGP